MTWKGKERETAVEEKLIDIGTEVSFLNKQWTKQNGIRMKRNPCQETV